MVSKKVLEELEKKTKKSKEIFENAKELTPYGVHSNYRALDPYPIYFRSGKGSRLYDADGNEYLDFNMAFGALTIGHSHPVLVKKLKERLENGTILGFEYENSYRLAKLITKIYNVDMVRFSMNGAMPLKLQ
jgi:Glutamate-1-semialdehyde aminotransferase